MRGDVLAARRAGVMLPVSALDHGSGVSDASARDFIDWLVSAGFTVWQVLPIGPAGADGSPYWLRSDYATDSRLVEARDRESRHIDTHELGQWRARERIWIDDYALFEALALAHAGAPWHDWPAPLRDREPDALGVAREEHASIVERITREQFLADQAWKDLRAYAHSRGVALFGDLPIYVAPDSVETWVHRGQFQLEREGRPSALAGVPPDYFAEDGQLWGNPLYDWSAMAADGYSWWRSRVRHALGRFDLLRLDHFRGLVQYWSVPAGARSARHGTWLPAGAAPLLRALCDEFQGSSFVAEDLGVITPDVESLRRDFHLPGMRVLQFAFDGSDDNPYLPYRHTPDSVVYTGTHDNDTTLGWYLGLEPATRDRVDYLVRARPGEMPEALVHTALGSVARLAIVPIADILSLDSSARINVPGTTTGNWSWRLPREALTPELAARYLRANRAFGRALLR